MITVDAEHALRVWVPSKGQCFSALTQAVNGAGVRVAVRHDSLTNVARLLAIATVALATERQLAI